MPSPIIFSRWLIARTSLRELSTPRISVSITSSTAPNTQIRTSSRIQVSLMTRNSRRAGTGRTTRLTPCAITWSRKRGRMPVASNLPSTTPSGETPVWRKRKISCIVTTSPSMPVISDRLTRRRRPSLRRATWITMWIADAICARAERGEISIPLIPIICSTRLSESRGVLAWTVVIDPSWPVFIACSMSNASPARTSPTMIRSGRMRSAFLTRSRWAISPLPSILAGRVSSRATWTCCSCSSAESSIVTIRSRSSI